MNNHLKVYARRQAPFGDSIAITLFDRAEGLVARPVAIEAIQKEDIGFEPQPTLELSNEEAQRLIDELWNVGLRPSEGSGSAGQLAATQRHLEDMRAMAFKSLGIDQPGGTPHR